MRLPSLVRLSLGSTVHPEVGLGAERVVADHRGDGMHQRRPAKCGARSRTCERLQARGALDGNPIFDPTSDLLSCSSVHVHSSTAHKLIGNTGGQTHWRNRWRHSSTGLCPWLARHKNLPATPRELAPGRELLRHGIWHVGRLAFCDPFAPKRRNDPCVPVTLGRASRILAAGQCEPQKEDAMIVSDFSWAR